jgi:hypothetical protein
MSTSADFWNAIPSPEVLDSEANVEHRLVLPLLHALGYGSDEIESKYPVEFQQGRTGRKHEADFVCFYGVLRDKSNSLLVVEAKAAGELLPEGKAQGESYAQNLRAPLLLLTNGENLEIWQLQVSLESECVLRIPTSQLAANRGEVERLLNKTAVRDYCASLRFKTIAEATSDFGVYETAELTRLKTDPPAIARTLRRQQIGGNEAAFVSLSLLSDFASGAVVIGPSGYGKTTLSRTIFKQAIEERWRGHRKAIAVEAPLPDLAESDVDFVSFLQQRISAHQPGVTLGSFKDSLRKVGATIVCDSLDRTGHDFQKRIATAIALFLRDYPLAQVFIFTRATDISISLPVLQLVALSYEQIRELEKIILADGTAEHLSIIGSAPPTLRSLCNTPLLLRLVLEYWKREHDFPRNLDVLFRKWLETVLDTEPNDTVSRAYRESALSIIALATTDAPVTAARAVALLKSNGIPEDILNALIQCNAVHETNSALEVLHESLADYLRARAFVEKSVADQLITIPALPLLQDSFLPVFLMALLVDRRAQNALWRHMVSGHIGIYLDALRYRTDISDELKRLDATELSEGYLTDLLKGIDEPLDGFFPSLRPSVVGWLAQERHNPLAVIGIGDAHGLTYKIHAQEPNQPRVVIAAPDFPGTIRGVYLDAARYRTDSARLLGMTLLKKGIEEAVETLDLEGGPRWSAERLMARVRLLSMRYGFNISVDDGLDRIEKAIQPYSDERIVEGPLVGRERFSFQSMLDDIAMLRAAGVATLDPWWLRCGWKDAVSLISDSDLARILDEEYRRVQLIYAEIVGASFSRHARDMLFFPILPIRWTLAVKRHGPLTRSFVVFPRWMPVKDWNDAGADVTFPDEHPLTFPPWEEVRDALLAFGRAPNVLHYGGFRTHFGYDGATPNGYFSGASPAVTEAMSLLRDDLRHMFRNLPSSDGAFAV